ncbi:hypothetical protein HYW41_04300 [Candidatus Daviesbacteria bacterium]|nr:hypothetical protein [Candidatus Daviesbacteria bacterium]
MDLLQIALIFLTFLLSIFLAITGVQVFFILRDLKKTLDRFNNNTTTSLVTEIAEKAKALTEIKRKEYKLKPKRFHKRVLMKR